MNRAISALRSWFRSVVRENCLPSPRAPVGRGRASGVMPVLLASERGDDYLTLQALLHNTKWSVARALSWGEASSFCGRVVNPVVLVDRHFQGSDWRSTFSSLLNPTANCCLILLSDVSDPYLWNELVQHGGFDVLARPFDRSQVLRTLAFAQKHCEGDWPPLHSPQENGDSPA
jgi:DNA-binding NtrC family response regulator